MCPQPSLVYPKWCPRNAVPIDPQWCEDVRNALDQYSPKTKMVEFWSQESVHLFSFGFYSVLCETLFAYLGNAPKGLKVVWNKKNFSRPNLIWQFCFPYNDPNIGPETYYGKICLKPNKAIVVMSAHLPRPPKRKR